LFPHTTQSICTGSAQIVRVDGFLARECHISRKGGLSPDIFAAVRHTCDPCSSAAADPSYQRSKTPISQISFTTEGQLRRRLAAIDPVKAALDLRTLLTRLGHVFEDTDDLNYAGDILLRTRDTAAVDYSHRSVPGGPGSQRVNDGGNSLLEELDRVEEAAMRNNPVTEITTGFGVQRLRALPERALGEAVLNGVCHREWSDPGATTAEHIGNELLPTDADDDVDAALVIYRAT